MDTVEVLIDQEESKEKEEKLLEQLKELKKSHIPEKGFYEAGRYFSTSEYLVYKIAQLEKRIKKLEMTESKLIDNGEITLVCSNCDKPLLIVWSNRPNEKRVWKLRATCPYCNDRSFAFDMKGGFAYRGYDKPIPGLPADEVIPVLNVKNVEVDNGEVLFITEFAPKKG
jgi:hypothetical protein